MPHLQSRNRQENPGKTEGGKKMAKVMIVDDHKEIVDTLKMIVTKEGHKTAEAYNGEELVSKVVGEKPDLILLDVMMPGLTTKQILDKLKALKVKTKIILVTVVRFSDEEKAALMKGTSIVDYVTKPFDLMDIVKRLKLQLK
jgi:two-component system alkaline phosphatase synthesis response regulator PhoP